MPYLEITTPRGVKRVKLESNPITVGREAGNVLVLEDERASRHHCVIEPVDSGFRVRDLNSRNGTKVNNMPVSEEVLDNGDVVRIGSTELRYINPEQEAPAKRNNTPDYKAAVQERKQF